MSGSQPADDLIGKLLIDMPGMGDSRFGRAVVYVCAHSPKGAMGLIINKPTPDLKFGDLLEQLGISTVTSGVENPLYFGGPVETGRGFVLHSSDYGLAESTLPVSDDFAMTATRDILQDIARGQGPKQAMLALGYSGWGPGQLEAELQQNGWLISEATPQIVFDSDSSRKWNAALATLGIDPMMLSAEGGRA